MKSEERHHLHENDLAQAIDRWVRKVEPWTNQILIGVLAVAVLAVGAVLWARFSTSKSQKGWGAFAKAQSADDFATVADDFPNSAVERWARLVGAEQYLNEALRVATTDKTTSNDRLQQAEKLFQKLLHEGHATPEKVRERALYGMAVCREATSGADTQPAITAYEELLKAYPGSRYAGLAKERIASLRKDSVRNWYAWFSQQQRSPQDRPQPRDLVTGRAAGSEAPLLPELPELTGGGEGPKAPYNPDRPPSPRMAVPAGEDASAEPFPGAPASEVQSPASTSPASGDDVAPGVTVTPPTGAAPEETTSPAVPPSEATKPAEPPSEPPATPPSSSEAATSPATQETQPATGIPAP